MQRILIIQTAFLGDVVLATPVLEQLKAVYPQSQIDFLLKKGNETLLKDHPHLHGVLVFDKARKRLGEVARLIRHIREQRYDLVINLHRFLSSGLMAVASGAREVVGFHKNPLSFLYHRTLPHQIGHLGVHEVDRNLLLVAHLTKGHQLVRRPKLYPPLIAQLKIAVKKPYVCIAPTSVWFTKQWPADKWSALIKLVPQKYTVYLLGAPADHPACEELMQQSKRDGVVNTCGALSLLASAALMAGAAMNYVNDSAPLHLASATNATVTAVFCSTVPGFGFGPLSENSRIVESEINLSCRPCGLHGHRACPKGHFKCADIDPLRVLGELD